MSVLKERIAAAISASGPIGVSEYMALCLFDPEHGYYTTREPFGTAGDFITAPEISQMFGELLGVWVRASWEAIGSPKPFTLAEIGPGRGTLMKDMLRALTRLDPTFLDAATIALVEISPRLAAVQKETLASSAVRIDWHEDVATLPRRPTILVANELFDAIPVRQFVHSEGRWHERVVGLDDQGGLRLMAGAASLDPSLLPTGETAAEGALFEVAPARTALMQSIAERLAADGGCGLFIDYGHAVPSYGDTLQAMRNHRHEDVLANPGAADLTTHVDFAALGAVALAAGLDAKLMTQGEFLLSLGLLERAGRLGAGAGESEREALRQAVERLAGPSAMGTLFKALTVGPPGIQLPPFALAH